MEQGVEETEMADGGSRGFGKSPQFLEQLWRQQTSARPCECHQDAWRGRAGGSLDFITAREHTLPESRLLLRPVHKTRIHQVSP